jgi:tetratricopeptide (TPR) repeat protein
MGNAEDTILYANKSLSIIPLNSPANLLLGEGYRLKKDYKAALSYYLKALMVDPGYFRAHGGFAQAYTEIGQEYGYSKGLVLRIIYHLEAYLTVMAENYDSYIKSHPDDLNTLKRWINIYDTYFSSVAGKESYRLHFMQKDVMQMSKSDSEYKKLISIMSGQKSDDLPENDILSVSNIPENALLKALESARKRIQLPL